MTMSLRSSLPFRPLTVLSLAAMAVMGTACAPTVTSGPMMPPPAAAATFSTEAFAWSTAPGRGGIDGRVAFQREGAAYACTGSVALTPDTPYTRQRFLNLYGSTNEAAVPEAVVRARTVADPNADYRSFVRSTTCADGRFTFAGLPDGGWFVIAPVSAGGERVILMRRVATRGGRVLTVTL